MSHRTSQTGAIPLVGSARLRPGRFSLLLRQVGRTWIAASCVVVGACSKPAARYDKDTAPERVAVPTSGGSAATASGSTGARPAGADAAGSDDARFHLRPDEGTLAIDSANGPVGAQIVANIVLTPATGFHISTDFPIKLTLIAPTGVKLAKAEWTAGGSGKSVGDASALSEQRLGFAIPAVADNAGTYEITGIFKFGICDKESCHPKRHPIAISIAANGS